MRRFREFREVERNFPDVQERLPAELGSLEPDLPAELGLPAEDDSLPPELGTDYGLELLESYR